MGNSRCRNLNILLSGLLFVTVCSLQADAVAAAVAQRWDKDAAKLESVLRNNNGGSGFFVGDKVITRVAFVCVYGQDLTHAV